MATKKNRGSSVNMSVDFINKQMMSPKRIIDTVGTEASMRSSPDNTYRVNNKSRLSTDVVEEKALRGLAKEMNFADFMPLDK